LQGSFSEGPTEVYQRLFGVDLCDIANTHDRSLPENWELSTMCFVHQDVKLEDLLKFNWTA